MSSPETLNEAEEMQKEPVGKNSGMEQPKSIEDCEIHSEKAHVNNLEVGVYARRSPDGKRMQIALSVDDMNSGDWRVIFEPDCNPYPRNEIEMSPDTYEKLKEASMERANKKNSKVEMAKNKAASIKKKIFDSRE